MLLFVSTTASPVDLLSRHPRPDIDIVMLDAIERPPARVKRTTGRIIESDRPPSKKTQEKLGRKATQPEQKVITTV